MNKSRGGEPFSGVHGTHLGAERVSALPEQQPAPLKRITTRLRLERVPVEPFVPSALSGYVDRSRVRQRLRWTLLIVGLLLASAAFYLSLRGPRTRPEVQLRTAPNESPLARPAAAEALSSPRALSALAMPPRASDQPAVPAPTSAQHATAARPPRPSVTNAPSAVARPKTALPVAPAAAPPVANSVSPPPKVPSDAPLPSSSAWWY